MSFQNDLENYIQRQNVTLQSEASLKESEDRAEQEKIQMEMARDEAGGQIVMGSIMPMDMMTRISGMKNFAKKLIGLKEGVSDSESLTNVKGWAKQKLGIKDDDDVVKMKPITAEDFEEPELRPAPAIPKTTDIFGDADDWLSGGDRSISQGISRVRAAPSSIDWEDMTSNTADYIEPTYSAADLGDMARESREMSAVAKASSLEKALGTRAPEQSFKYSGITQGQSEFQRGIKSNLSDAFAERKGYAPIASETASEIVLPDFDEIARGEGVRGFGERFSGGVESGMARAGEQRGSSMLANVIRAEAERRLPTTGEEIVPEITPTLTRRLPQFQQGGEATDIPDFPESLQVPESLRTDIPTTEVPTGVSTGVRTGVTSRLRSTLGMEEDDDVGEEAEASGSWLSSMMPQSIGEGVGTGLAIVALGGELYSGITSIKDAFKESHLIGQEQQDINRESQAIYNRPTFDFGQQAISNRDSGLGESSFNHF